jgi:hypothetical protein
MERDLIVLCAGVLLGLVLSHFLNGSRFGFNFSIEKDFDEPEGKK